MLKRAVNASLAIAEAENMSEEVRREASKEGLKAAVVLYNDERDDGGS